jgi:hypothetical protein
MESSSTEVVSKAAVGPEELTENVIRVDKVSATESSRPSPATTFEAAFTIGIIYLTLIFITETIICF